VSPRDHRSVGELLAQADSTARQLLFDADAGNARDLVRGWGEIVQAAAALWEALPAPPGPTDPTMGMIEATAARAHRAHARTGWPGPGQADPRQTQIADDLTRAADLVTRLARVDPPLRLEAARDVTAARTRLIHTVYVASHAVTVAVGAHIADTELLRRSRGGSLPAGESVAQPRATLARVTSAERLAGTYLVGRWPAALTGEHREPAEPGRLSLALAGWNLQAYRTLTADPTTGTLLYIAHVQHHIAITSHLVMAGAAAASAIDPARFHNGHQAALIAHEASWTRLGSLLHHLTAPAQRRVDTALLAAGHELRAAIRDLTHDGATPRSTTRIGHEIDLAAASLTLHGAAAAEIDLVRTIADAVANASLEGSARAVQNVSARTTIATPLQAWVPASDLHRKTTTPINDPTRGILTQAVRDVAATMARVDSEGSYLSVNRPGHSSPPTEKSSTLPEPVKRIPAVTVPRDREVDLPR